MNYRRTSRNVVVAIGLLVSWPFYSANAADNQTPNSEAKKEVPVRIVRETFTSKTFSPAAAEFLKRPLPAPLVTLNPGGGPQVTIMWFRYEDGALFFTTTTDRVKFRNQQKDPRAVLTVLEPTNMYKWVIVHGKLSVDNRDPAAFYRSLAEHYLEGEGLAQWRKMAVMDKRTVLKLTPTRIRTMGFPKE